jgi:hypothetical protein
MILGIDVCHALSAVFTPHNPILLVFLAVGLGYFLDLVPDDER